MKKAYFLSAFIWCLLALAACSKETKETEEESRYYEVQVEDSGQLEEMDSGQFLLGQQYYHGEPVSLIAEWSESGEAGSYMDVYIRPLDGDKQLVMSAVSTQYRVRGWFLDEKGRCYVRGATALTGLDEDGNPLYQSTLSGLVTDMCCTEEGRVILLVQATGGRSLAELDPDTGNTTPIESVSLDFGSTYINSLGNDLMILNDSGVWQADLKKGTKNLILSFKGTAYSLETSETITDFWSDGSGINILWSSGKSERLEWADVNISGKEIITVRVAYPDRITNWLKKHLALFNQSNDSYYAVLEELDSGMDEMNFRAQTNLQLASGKGADIICSDALYDEVSALIEKGVFADLSPMIEASGIREEDYFPAAFDAWRDGDKIYGIVLRMRAYNYSLDKTVLNGREELTIETFVDSLLEFEEDRCFSTNWDSSKVLYYFLQGSEDLCGMVDWEKGTCDFSGELFSKMLLAAKRYGAKDMRQQYPEILTSRQCSQIYKFETAKKLEANNQVELGLFFEDGIYPASVAFGIMGVNAESEHVEGAWQLLAFLLGKEAQSTIDIYSDELFPTNKSVFDKLAQAELEYGDTIVTEHNGKTYTAFFPGRNFGSKNGGYVVLEEQTVTEMRQLLSEARTRPYKTEPLLTIITEETAYYFDGPKSMEDVIAVVQNKVQLYLDEHKTGR